MSVRLTAMPELNRKAFDILQRRYSVADDFYVSRGSHSVSFGGSFDRLATDINAPFQWGGVWAFTSLQTFLQNQPASIIGALPGQDNAYREFRENDFTAYLQDQWRATSRLTLNLGLRYAPTTNAVVAPGITLVDPPRSPAFTPVGTVFAGNASLKNFDPHRYGPLSFANPLPLDDPGNCQTVAADSSRTTENGLAWDIYTQVGALLRTGGDANPLSYGHRHASPVKRVYGFGYSQIGGYLYDYINAIHPLATAANGGRRSAPGRR